MQQEEHPLQAQTVSALSAIALNFLHSMLYNIKKITNHVLFLILRAIWICPHERCHEVFGVSVSFDIL